MSLSILHNAVKFCCAPADAEAWGRRFVQRESAQDDETEKHTGARGGASEWSPTVKANQPVPVVCPEK